ncbi:MinD/ParA family protein [Thiohalobacter sp. IOR34]|uniref:MinD/ParA family protein n=1 Tax=Thiohalobacter sp. IOR34 TaxID=3057176 RepID=UPI0025B0542A|nr:MinD/ParA family protein [Thiohalobacter sp. IOR34]WJW76642.1 MinD/ParA family protein [Thiohalobacter sp. IOR34]
MPRIITVTSGKGGVGKTQLSVNLAHEFARRGQKACLFDADLGLANANILLDIRPERTLEDVIEGRCGLADIIVRPLPGLDVVPGSSGIEKMANLAPFALAELREQFDVLDQYDVLIFDTSSGVGRSVLQLALASPEVLLVMTPEPTSLTDAYALLKLLRQNDYGGQLRVVVNAARSSETASHTFQKFREVARVYLRLELELLASIPYDAQVQASVREQQPITLAHPEAAATRAIVRLADSLLAAESPLQLALSEFWWRYSNAGGERPGPREAPTAPAPRRPEAADAASREAQLETKLDLLLAEMQSMKAELAQLKAVEAPRSATEEPAQRQQPPGKIERRGGVQVPGHSRALRGDRRPTPIDSLALRCVVGRLLVGVMQASDGSQPVQIDSGTEVLAVDNPYNLLPGRYSSIALGFSGIDHPDDFVEEVFTSCAITGCKVHTLGSNKRYWPTRDRDGCLLLDESAAEGGRIRIYLPIGQPAFEGVSSEQQPRARLSPEPAQEFDWRRRYADRLQALPAEEAGGSRYYELQREGRPPVIFVQNPSTEEKDSREAGLC